MFSKKLLLLSVSALIFSSVPVFAKMGTESGGGGDASEARVNEIRADILLWIINGGAKNLALPEELSNEEYVNRMTEVLQPQNVVIGFVEKDDELNEELKVSVGGIPKTCRGFKSSIDLRLHIICNISRFKSTSDSEKYKLIHHEFAGLAMVEHNKGAASDYKISSQITNFLTRQTVLKLAVIPARHSPRVSFCENVYINYSSANDIVENEAALEIKKYFKERLDIQFILGPMDENYENDQIAVAKNSTIISLNSETDFTGSEIEISVYNSNSEGEISFAGRRWESAFFSVTKKKKLAELAKSAIYFSCGLTEYK